MQQGPPISPDGNYWWDGAAWQPMPKAVPPPPPPQPQAQPRPAIDRPSWLPEGSEHPGHYSGPPALEYQALPVAEAPSYYQSPAWAAPQAPSSSRLPIMIAAGAALVLMAGSAGVYALVQSSKPSLTGGGGGGNPVAVATASPSAGDSPAATDSPSTTPTEAASVLTGNMDGSYCPVAHPVDPACWEGTFGNTGPPIRKLAIMFLTSPGFDDWFAHHAYGRLVPDTTPGCTLDPPHLQIVCGSVPTGGVVSIHLTGVVTTQGIFQYAVKFADISSGSPVYVNEHPDGTHDVVSWYEVVQ